MLPHLGNPLHSRPYLPSALPGSLAFSRELLKTFAAVPVGQRVLVVNDSPNGDAEALLQLGFNVEVLPTEGAQDNIQNRLIALSPDDSRWRVLNSNHELTSERYHWVIYQMPDAGDVKPVDDLSLYRESLRSGGWIYLRCPLSEANAKATYSPRLLQHWVQDANLAEASAPWHVSDENELHAIYRRVDEDTPA